MGEPAGSNEASAAMTCILATPPALLLLGAPRKWSTAGTDRQKLLPHLAHQIHFVPNNLCPASKLSIALPYSKPGQTQTCELEPRFWATSKDATTGAVSAKFCMLDPLDNLDGTGGMHNKDIKSPHISQNSKMNKRKKKNCVAVMGV